MEARHDHSSVPQEKEITAQLQRILASREFITSRRLSDFLRFVVECTITGESKAIKQYSIGVEVYGRDSSFDPKSDPLVRIEASRLRRALDKYYKNTGKSDSIIFGIPRGTYVPRFSLRSDEADDDLKSDPHDANHASPPTLERPVIAVFPLENLGGDQHDYLTSGIGEELTAELSRCPDLRVVAFSSTVQSELKSKSIREHALDFGADFTLHGRMRRSGPRIRINIHLIEVPTGEQIWSERFDEDFSPPHFFDIEDKVVHQVLARVADSYGIIPRLMGQQAKSRRVTDPSEFEAILRHHHYNLTLSAEAFDDSLNALEHASKLKPPSAAILGMLGLCYLDSDIFGYADIPEAVERGIQLAGKAVSLDPDCQYAQLTRAYAGMVERDRNAIIGAADRIVAINPNAAFMSGAAGFWLCLAGEYERGISLFERSTELNPLFPSWLHAAPYFYHLHANDFDKALYHANEFGLPDFFWGPIMRTAVLGLLKQTAEAKLAFDRIVSLKPDFSGKEEEYVRVFVLDEQVANMMLEGLRAAN